MDCATISLREWMIEIEGGGAASLSVAARRFTLAGCSFRERLLCCVKLQFDSLVGQQRLKRKF
jgi:hypothetical protein